MQLQMPQDIAKPWATMHTQVASSVCSYVFPVHVYKPTYCVKPILRWVLDAHKFWSPFISGKSYVYTIVLNDIITNK